MPTASGEVLRKAAGRLLVFLAGYVALFVAVPPVPLCMAGVCVFHPRPEAFLLAAALALGPAAVVGTALGGFAAILLYEAIHPAGLTLLDGVVAGLAFLAAGGAGRVVLRRLSGLEGAVAATWAVTALVVLVVGSYAAAVRDVPRSAAYLAVLGEAFLPINVVGLAFLVWWERRRARVRGGARPPASGTPRRSRESRSGPRGPASRRS